MKLHNQMVKRTEKDALKEDESVPFYVLYEQDTSERKIIYEQLEKEYAIEEKQYKLVATDKKEKRLKAGVDMATAGRHEANIECAMSKRDDKIEEITSKCERKIEILTAEIKDLETKLVANIKTIKTNAQHTIDYFKPLVDRCYEEVEAVVNYPPSHFKKQATIASMKADIDFRTIQLLNMKVAESNIIPAKTNGDIIREQRRAMAISEAAQQLAQSEARQYELECQTNIAKKAEYAADVARRRERQAERDKVNAECEEENVKLGISDMPVLAPRIFKPQKCCTKINKLL